MPERSSERTAQGKAISHLTLAETSNPTGRSSITDHAWLEFVTRYDYYKVMKSVRIAELKARLSEHLRQVRRGRTLVVLDRNTPIARLVPYEGDSASLTIRRPAGKVGGG